MRKPTMTPTRKIASAAIGLILLLAAPAYSQNYTVAPTPFQTAMDNSGHIINNSCVWTYSAGTTTPATTYSDNIGTSNANPIRSDSAGRFTVYLLAGTNYKFVYESACTPPAHGTTLRTADNISGVPASAATVDVTGTAGEALTAGQVVYLSDGSGSKTAGQWFKADSATAYSNTQPEVGMVPASIASGSSGTIRLAGSMTGLSSLTTGSSYYVGTGGAVTATAPGASRFIGVADTTTSLVLTTNPPPAVATIDNATDGFRLGASSATCVPTADITAATTLYLTPCYGSRIALYNSTGVATIYTSAEISIAVPATTSQMYDVYGYANGATPTLELLAWTNDTTRATAITRTTTGVFTKSGDLTRRYLGSFRTTAVSGQTEDSFAKRFVWNYYNRIPRLCRVTEATDSWTYSTATYRQANASTANQVAVVIGVAEVAIDLRVFVSAQNTGGANVYVSIGEDSTTTPATGTLGQSTAAGNAAAYAMATAQLVKYPAIGYHFYAWLERNSGSTATWFGDNADATLTQSGLHGVIQG